MDTSVATSVDDICGGGGDAMVVTMDEDDLFLGVDGESRELCFSWVEDSELRTIIVSNGDGTVLPSPPSKNGDVTPKTREQISRAKDNRPQIEVYNFSDLFSPSRSTVTISHPSNDDVTPKTQEQISRAKDNRPQMKVYNFNDLFSPSRSTVTISHPSNDDVTPKTREQISRAKDNRPQMKVYNFNDLFSPSRSTVTISLPSNDDQERGRMDTHMEPPHQDDPEVIQVTQERKKRIRWTADEHKLFLMGYKKFHKKWTKVSKNYIPWKTPSQLASHAQKYILRQDMPVENWIKYTVNNFSSDNLTPEDYSRLAPHRRPPPATASPPMSNRGPTPVQQSLHAAVQKSNTAGSSSMHRPARLLKSFDVPMQSGNIRGFSLT